MAEYYTQFSMTIENLCEEEKDWFTRHLDPEVLSDKKYLEYRHGFTDDLDEKECWPPWAWSWDDAQTLWLHDDAGDADLEALACLLSDFLRDNRPEMSICLEWANTCSKPRLDSFGGGAVFITHHEVQWHSTNAWLTKQHNKFQDKIREVESNGK